MSLMNIPKVSAAWLAAGLSLAFATQLRISGIPVGIGEVVLLLWFVATVLTMRRAGAPLLSRAEKPFLLLWGVSILALAIGTLNAAAQGIAPPPGTALHDALAYLFSAGLSLAFIAWYRERRDENFPYILSLILAVPVIALWMVALRTETLFGHLLWSSYRFLGWSANPNQTALSLLLVPFLLFHFLEEQRPSLPRLTGCLVLGGLAVLAGWSVSSSAGRLAWTIGLPLLFVAPLIASGRLYRVQARTLALGGAFVLVVLVVGNILVGLETRTVRPEPKAASADLSTQVKGVFINKDIGDQDKVGIRMSLIINATKVIAASKGLGFGPGSFSGLDGPFGVSEAHNSILDWGMSGGILAMAAFLILFGKIAYQLWRRQHHSLLIGLLTLAIYAQFHHVLRHPLVWIFLAYAWLEGQEQQQRDG